MEAGGSLRSPVLGFHLILDSDHTMPNSSQQQDLKDLGLIVAAGGSSTRFGGPNKLLLPLGPSRLAVFCHCLQTLTPLLTAARSILVIPENQQDAFHAALAAAHLDGAVTVVPGGRSRQDSVQCGLKALPPEVSIVAVQDAARPLVSRELLARCVNTARLHGAGIAAAPVTDTIKIADSNGMILTTPERTTLWAAQTPQVFRKNLLTAAYARCQQDGREVTDDAQAMEVIGYPVALVENLAPNPKLTRPEDLTLAEYLLQNLPRGQHPAGAGRDA
jgi:2-C-methyl-D-erythritol 4-phosphate cytidylyltransferase